MIWRDRPLGGRRQRACRVGGRTLALWCVLSTSLAAAVALARPGIAAASGSGTLTFTPLSGPPGTQVTVTIAAEPPGPTPYVLSASPTDPASNTCADGVQLSDAPKIIVVPDQPTTTTFTWPADFFSGAYYLCASPAGGQKGSIVWSQQPFSVSSGTPPGPSSIPASSGVVAQAPPGGVTSGGVVTLIVDTSMLGGDTPQGFGLTQPGKAGAMQVNWLAAGQGQRLSTYIYDIIIPIDTLPGTYEIRVTAGDGSLAATSNTFQVVSAPARGGGPGGSNVSSHPPIAVRGASAISPFGALLVAVIVLLLTLAVASLAAPLLRRQRHHAHTPDTPTHWP